MIHKNAMSEVKIRFRARFEAGELQGIQKDVEKEKLESARKSF
ncbi:hypothetical protein LEP1GSC072_2600 [Leptospira noguchii str. Bonito]|nr:hypothetical protein LEP1GSC072_2600 [Leptospira noguchii str. Bonito]